jgi:hypothetical protein
LGRHLSSNRLRAAAALCAAIVWAAPAFGQVTPAAGYTPPDDTPSIKVGVTIFMDYTVQDSPKIKDSDGNDVTLTSFNVGRSYINVTGNINHLIAFRVTPDITRESGTGSSLAGSYTFRLKYAYAQFNLDDWMTRGSWARFGQQQTPFIDYAEGIYRYRFQGTIFPEREGYMSSADEGVSFHYNVPQNYGDVHAGYYNGENYNKPEVNNEKSFQIRGTLRPLAQGDANLRGLRVTGFYNADSYVKDGDRNRGIFEVSYEHKYLNAAYDYLATSDQTSITKDKVDGHGWSTWLTPKYPLASRPGASIEALFRYDSYEPNKTLSDQKHKREIFGLAYWFPHQGNVSTALLVDYDNATFDNFVNQPMQRKYAVHGLINF